MKVAGSRSLLLVGLLVVVGLPLLGAWLRRHQSPRCALDGLAIDRRFQVRVVERTGQAHCFCCVRCASQWLARQAVPAGAVYVTDEATSAEIAAERAIFVESAIVGQPTTGNRVHVFRTEADALMHARAFAGQILTDADRPFAKGRP